MNLKNYIDKHKRYLSPQRQYSQSKENRTGELSNNKTQFLSYRSPKHNSLFKVASIASPSSLQKRKLSLPPISQYKKPPPIFDLQTKRSQVVNKFFLSKQLGSGNGSVHSHRSKTEGVSNIKYKLSPNPKLSANLQEIRMKPVDKYFYKLDNIRLAERLLVVKPSPQIRRDNQKKFYLQQKHYRFQISRNYNVKGKKWKNLAKLQKKEKIDKKWLQ